MKVPPTQEEIDAAEDRWNEDAKRHAAWKAKHGAITTVVWIMVVVAVVLFLPTERASYDSTAAWLRKTANYLIYRVPCMAPESSLIGKWVRAKQIDCAKLSL